MVRANVSLVAKIQTYFIPWHLRTQYRVGCEEAIERLGRGATRQSYSKGASVPHRRRCCLNKLHGSTLRNRCAIREDTNLRLCTCFHYVIISARSCAATRPRF